MNRDQMDRDQDRDRDRDRDREVLDGEPLSSGVSVEDDLDGMPMKDGDLDGMPLDDNSVDIDGAPSKCYCICEPGIGVGISH